MMTIRQQSLRAAISGEVTGTPTLSELSVLFPTLAAATEVSRVDHFLDGKGIYNHFGPQRGEVILQTLEAVAVSESPLAPIIARALDWLQPQNLGVNLASDATRAMLTLLAPAVITSGEAAYLIALGESVTPKWSGLTLAELSELYQADYIAQYSAEQALIAERAAIILGAYEEELQSDHDYWTAYQASSNARNQALRDALDQASEELIGEGLIRG